MELVPILFPPGLCTSSRWKPLDHSLATATLKACLLSPRSEKKRSRYQTGLYMNLLDQVMDVGNRDLMRWMLTRVIDNPKEFGKLSSINDYYDRLYFKVPGRKERTRQLRYMQDILIVGLTLKQLMRPAPPRRRGETPLDVAQEAVAKRYSGSLGMSVRERRAAWFKWRHVAHFCAAIVDFLPQTGLPTVDEKFFDTLKKDMPALFATAGDYARFLAGESPIEGVYLSSQLTRHIKLLVVPPDIRHAGDSRVQSEMPRWR